MDRVPITKEGVERLRAELSDLERVQRPENIRAIEEARGHGDISENAEYHAAKERQAFIDAKINELKTIIGKAQVIEVEEGRSDRVVFGKRVRIYNLKTDEEMEYQLLGPYESEPEKGRISVISPLGQALVGKEAGDEVQVETPSGRQEYEILEIF
jgi:transcription elongation factor GreA